MRQGARPGTPDRLSARRVASPWLTQGKGYLRLNVRDGFVVAGEYGWLAEEVVLETQVATSRSTTKRRASSRCVIKIPKGRKLFALAFRNY